MSTVLLEAQNIAAWYGSSRVLHGVSLRIDAGQTVGLLGRNGMGKTTLIRSLLGHQSERSGSIRFKGKDYSSAKPHELARAGIAYVPEGRGVFPNLSVRENLLMAAVAGPVWTLDKVLATFPRLAERITNLGSELSGGEQQMLSISRALMRHPELLILDEATEGLAPKIVAEIWSVIDTIRTSGIATLIVDRNYRQVLARCDRALVLQKGVVVLEGAAAELSANTELAGLLGV
jgi:branched-chain amino acid transport system ATP-binding protein